MVRSRDVEFMEEDFSYSLNAGKSNDYDHLFDFTTVGNLDQSEDEFQNTVDLDDVVNNPEVRRSTRVRSIPERPGIITGEWWVNEDLDFANTAALTDEEEPKDLAEALSSKYSLQWKKAFESEYESLAENNTWELVDMPPGKNLVGCKWIFKIKRDENGEIDRFKARLVAQGFSQREGLDFNEVFAPVARYNSIRVVLALANALNLELHQIFFSVSNWFLLR